MTHQNKTVGQLIDEEMTRDDFIASINSGISAIGIEPDQDYDAILLKSGIIELASLLDLAMRAAPNGISCPREIPTESVSESMPSR